MTATRREKSMKIPPPLCAPPRCTLGQISKICKETSNLMWWSLIEFISVLFDCLLKVIMYNSKPQNQMCDWNIKCFCFVLQKILNQALYMTHTFDSEVSLQLLVALAHGVSWHPWGRQAWDIKILEMKCWCVLFFVLLSKKGGRSEAFDRIGRDQKQKVTI